MRLCNVSGPWFPVGLRRPLCFVLVDHTLEVPACDPRGAGGGKREATGSERSQ